MTGRTARALLLIVTSGTFAASAPRGPVWAQDGPAATGKDFDARIARVADIPVAPAPATLAALDGLRLRVPQLATTVDAVTGVTRTMFSHAGYLTDAVDRPDAVAIATDFLRANLPALGLTPAALADAETTDVAINRTTGSTHLYLRQRFQGLPVYNAQLQVNVNRDGRIISVNNAFHPSLAQAAAGSSPALGADRALAAAAEHLGINGAGPARIVSVDEQDPRRRSRLDAPGLSLEPVDATLMWLPVSLDDARLVWNFQLHTLDQRHVYDVNVDARSAEVMTRFDWVANDQYTVYQRPVESPAHATPGIPADGRTTVSNPADSTASPFGWHDTNGAAGAEFTSMRGNNVHAYDDIDANNAPPASEPSCGASLNCAFSIDLTQEPANYTSAAIANLFYWNNVVHDVQYRYGFTEAAGNFQANNYGRGGLANDDVRAEAQDGLTTNNANMLTLPDGSRPRMQMFLWNVTTPKRDSDFDNGVIVHEYGHGISNRLVGGPSNVSCLNNNQQPGEGLSDWWALVYTATAGDTGAQGRGIGTYVVGQTSAGVGIRGQKYSTDPAVNTWTYASINGMAIPHGVGAVWAQAMWKVYWALVEVHGFSANLYDATGTAGNLRAMLYVNEGLMNTICSPAFTDVRDGIIQAAADNHGGQDVCVIWQAFAAFGLGANAVSGGPTSTTPVNGFALPSSCDLSLPSMTISDLRVAEGHTGTRNAIFAVNLSVAPPTAVTASYVTSDGSTSTVTPANTASITIPSNGNATPYPSNLTAGAGLGTISNLRVRLHRFSHTWPADVDVLLVGPTGQTCLLMSDVGSSHDVADLALVFDDAGAVMPTSTVLSSTTYRPTNVGLNDTFSSPAPAGPYGATLAGFAGTNPEGVWKLYIVDAVTGDSGSVAGGWSLELTTSLGGDYVTGSGTLSIAAGSATGSISVTVNGDTVSESSETFTVTLSNSIGARITDAEGTGTIVNDDFTDATLSGAIIKVAHITELRTAIDEARVAKGLGNYSFTDTLGAGVPVRAYHISELRTALNEAYDAAGQTRPTYTDPTLGAGATVIKAVHLTELRAAATGLP